MIQEEVWKPVIGYEGLYEVSNLGNVKSVEKIVGHPTGQCRRPEKILKLINNSAGYSCVNLCKNGKSRFKAVHIIVAEAFLEKPDGRYEVDHINRNRKDNNVENLRWYTHKENMNNANTIQYMKESMDKSGYSRLGLTAKALKGSSQAPKNVYQYTLNGEYIAEYPSIQDAEKATGIYHTSISKVIDRFEFRAGNYIWSSEKVNSVKYNPQPKNFFHSIQQLDESGVVISEWESINKAMRGLHLGYKRIIQGLQTGEFKYKEKEGGH